MVKSMLLNGAIDMVKSGAIWKLFCLKTLILVFAAVIFGMLAIPAIMFKITPWIIGSVIITMIARFVVSKL